MAYVNKPNNQRGFVPNLSGLFVWFWSIHQGRVRTDFRPAYFRRTFFVFRPAIFRRAFFRFIFSSVHFFVLEFFRESIFSSVHFFVCTDFCPRIFSSIHFCVCNFFRRFFSYVWLFVCTFFVHAFLFRLGIFSFAHFFLSSIFSSTFSSKYFTRRILLLFIRVLGRVDDKGHFAPTTAVYFTLFLLGFRFMRLTK